MPALKSQPVSASTLAGLFGITVARIGQLVADGVITKTDVGRYDLLASVRGYVSYLRTKKNNQWSSAASEPGGGDGEDYEAQRTRLTKAKADLAEMQAGIMRGTVHEAAAVEHVWVDHLMSCRARLLGVANRLAPRLHGIDEISKIESEIDAAIHDALEQLADYDADLITSKYVSAHRRELEATTEMDSEPVGGRKPKAKPRGKR
jgi:phage terminase Nu1 subunit (DNA packaging protein)